MIYSIQFCKGCLNGILRHRFEVEIGASLESNIFFLSGGCEGLVGVVCLYRRHHLFRVLRVGDFLAGDDGTETHGGDIEAEHRGEEGVVPCLVNCESLFGVPGEQTGDKVLCLGGEVLEQGVPQIVGLQEGLLDRVASKGGEPVRHAYRMQPSDHMSEARP